MYAWKSHIVVQADYQHWANEVLFTALDYLQPDVIDSDQGLFFNSIHHTVDHLLQVSQLWHARLQGEPLTVSYKTISITDWRELKLALRRETRKLQNWLEAQPPEFFDSQIAFIGSEGRPYTMWARDALTHLYTHYRLGAPCPEMDFLFYRREMERLLNDLKQASGAEPQSPEAAA
jgi:uncharacterized damage-inducible protein DinB